MLSHAHRDVKDESVMPTQTGQAGKSPLTGCVQTFQRHTRFSTRDWDGPRLPAHPAPAATGAGNERGGHRVRRVAQRNVRPFDACGGKGPLNSSGPGRRSPRNASPSGFLRRSSGTGTLPLVQGPAPGLKACATDGLNRCRPATQSWAIRRGRPRSCPAGTRSLPVRRPDTCHTRPGRTARAR